MTSRELLNNTSISVEKLRHCLYSLSASPLVPWIKQEKTLMSFVISVFKPAITRLFVYFYLLLIEAVLNMLMNIHFW